MSNEKYRLNDLDGKEWIYNSKSWFTLKYKSRNEKEVQHPAKYPEELAERFISYFTKKGEWVLDPFAGVGSTLVACKYLKNLKGELCSRNAVGIELSQKYALLSTSRLSQKTLEDSGKQYIINGDSSRIDELLKIKFTEIPKFSLIMTSPPYWNMIKKSRGGSDSAHKDRKEKGLDLTYSDNPDDLGNIDDYARFIEKLSNILTNINEKGLLTKNAHLILVTQNFLNSDGKVYTLAWDIANKLREYYELRQEQIWCQENKNLGIWGFPSTYISNVHHHYCIILRVKR